MTFEEAEKKTARIFPETAKGIAAVMIADAVRRVADAVVEFLKGRK